jgi:hypothetical protein
MCLERILKSNCGSVVDTGQAMIDGILNDKQYPACYHLMLLMHQDKELAKKISSSALTLHYRRVLRQRIT